MESERRKLLTTRNRPFTANLCPTDGDTHGLWGILGFFAKTFDAGYRFPTRNGPNRSRRAAVVELQPTAGAGFDPTGPGKALPGGFPLGGRANSVNRQVRAFILLLRRQPQAGHGLD